MEKHRMRLGVALALVALVLPTTFTAPATRSSCTPVCRKSLESKLNYQEGKTYTYGFETEVLTEVIGSTDETSKIKVKGQAVFAAQSACDFILTLQQVAIQSPSGQAISRVNDIEGTSLRFAYQDGEIENVCVSDDDPTWSANVKRAIISMLTNKANKATDDSSETIETDISGRCPTQYTISGNKYTKTRNLNGCTHRDGGASVFLGVPYDVSSSYNSLPVVDSNLVCEQEITDGVFQSVSCIENHKLPVLSSSDSGVHTQIKSSLNIVSTNDGLVRGSKSASKSSSVFYDHSEIQEVQRSKTSASRAVDYLNKICQEIESGAVSSKVPGLHLLLIKSLKSARKNDVKQMYDEITSDRMCPKATEKLQKLFLDAAASAVSDGTIAFLAEVIVSGQAGCHTKALFNAYTAFAPRPDVAALEAMESLISQSEVEPEYLLTASALAHQYCRMTNPECASNNEYHSLVDKIAQHVRTSSDDEGLRKIVAALQALGNLDQLTPAAVTAITNVLDDKQSIERVKVRALDAFRRDPCQEQLKGKAWDILNHFTESSHVRIQAYLTISKCLGQNDVQAMQNLLEAEKSNQVGSFVISHIENVLESASPSKDGIKAVFRQLTIPKDFPRDGRKFSRNLEISHFIPDLNVGGSLDGNLIFSQDSYIPRTSSANLTVDAFGRSYNLFELGVYAEDFEHLFEKYFGPTGKIRKTNLEHLITEGSDKLNRLVETVRGRFRRDVKVTPNENEIEDIRQKVDIEERTGQHGVADVYIRIMGTSLMVESFNQKDLNSGSFYKKVQKGVEKILDGGKDHKFDITEPILFLDEELIIPTFSGFPLTIEIEGTSILSMQVNGNFNPFNFRSKNMQDMRAKIIPSAATLIKSRMTVGTGPIESGLQLEGKIHSSAGVDVKVVKEDDKFEFKFNLPQERTQIIDMRSDIYWVEQPQDGLEKKTPVQTKLQTRSIIDNECMNTFSKVLGLKVCADVRFPQVTRAAPLPFLNGPSVLSLSVEKSESTMEGYYLKIEKNEDKDAGNYAVEFLLDTPGSRTDRKISASIQGLKYQSTTPEYLFKLVSPWTKLDVDYKRSFTDQLKGVNIKIVHDGDAFAGRAELKKVKAGSVNKFEPVVEYTLPGGKPVKLVEGHVVLVENQGKLEIDVRTAGPMRNLRGSVKGTVEMPRRDDSGFEILAKNLALSSELVGNLILDGSISKLDDLLETKMKAQYGLKTTEHNLEVETKVGYPENRHFVFNAKTRSSRCAWLNFDLTSDIVKGDQSLKTELTYTRGLSDPKVQIHHKLSTEIKSRKEFEIFNEITFKHPEMGVDVYHKLDTKAAPTEPRHAEFVFNANTFKSNAKYQSTGKHFLDYKWNANAEYSGKTYEFSEVASKVDDFKQNFKSKIAVTPGFWYALDTDVTYKFEKDDIESLIKSTVTSDRFGEPVVFKTGIKGKDNEYSALLKVDLKGKNYVDILTRCAGAKDSKPHTINAKAFVLNYLESKLTQTMSKSGGDMQLDVKWVPTGRKIEARSKMAVQGEVYDWNADLKWDAEKDASKSISVKSNTKIGFSNWQMESKNDINCQGRTSKWNMNGKLSKEFLNGEDSFDVSYISPEGKTYNVASVMNTENKPRVKAGKINLKVTLPGESTYELTWENRVSNINTHERTFEGVSDFKFDYKGEKDVKLHAEASSSLPGNYRSYAGKFDASGSVMSQPISAQMKTDVRKGKLAVKGSATRGTREGSVDVSIDYDTWSPKKTISYKYIIKTPFDRVKTLEGSQKYAFLFNAWNEMEYSEEATIALNEDMQVQWKALFQTLKDGFNFNDEIMYDGETLYKIVSNGRVNSKTLTTDIDVTYRKEKSFLNIEIDHQFPEVGIELKGGIPKSNFEFKATHTKSGDSVYETDVLAKSDDELAFRVTNKVELGQQKKSFDLLLAAADEPTRRVYLLVNQAKSDKYNVEALLRWGDGSKYLSTKGDLSRSDGGFEATLSLDSPEVKASKMHVKLAKTSAGGRHTVDLKVKEGTAEKFHAEFDFNEKEQNYQKTYDGSLKVKGDKSLVDVDFNGKFKLEDMKMSRSRGDSEDGRQLRASVEVGKTASTPLKAQAVLKTSDKEKRAQLSFCNEEKASCNSGDVHLRHQRESNGNLEYVLRIVGESDKAGQKSATGVSMTTTKDGQKYDHIVKLILNKENSEQVGYRLYAQNGNEIGAEILLPERVIASVMEYQRPKSTDLKVEFNFYIDKTRKPERKISMIFNTEKHDKSTGYGRDVELVFKHPEMSKDLKVHTRAVFGGDETFLDVKTTLDIFKAGSEIVVVYKAQKEKVTEGNLYKTEWSVKSKGQQINFGGKSEISRTSGQLSYKQDLYYENRENEMRNAKIETLLSLSRMSFEVHGHSKKVISFVSIFDKHPSGYEYRQEVFLPGMEDARIFQAVMTTVSPRKAQLKTYTSNSPSGVYYEAFLGFKNDDHFAAGFYDHEAEGKKVLADFNLALNNSRILFVKTDWDKENIKNVWTKTQARADRTGKNLKQMALSSTEEIFKELQFASTNMRKSSPNFKPAISAAKDNLADLAVELDAHDDTKLLIQQFQTLRGYFKQYVRVLFELTKVVRRLAISAIYAGREFLENLPEIMKDYTSQIPITMEDVQKMVEKMMNCMIDVSRKTMKLMEDACNKISENMPQIINKINWILDITSDIGKVLRDFLESALDEAAVYWKSLRSLVKDILANDIVQMILKDAVAALQTMLAEFIEESKNHAETFKNYVLESVPQKEFQEVIQLVVEYVEKKARGERVDDTAAIKEIYDKFVTLVKKIGNEIFTFDSNEGFFLAKIPLPVPIKSLSELTKIFQQMSFPTVPKISYNVPAYKFGIRETVNKLRNGAMLDAIIPPFDAYALLIGSQFYKTFDGKFYQFDGDCQYLLASDFEDGNFTVVVDYEKKGPISNKAFIVSDSQTKIAIKPDHTVVVNGEQVNLDQTVKSGAFEIQRKGDWIVIAGEKGVKAGCSLTFDVCAVKVNGFYHGKVMGLWGKFNQEEFDDMSTPEGNIVTDVQDLAKSWKIENQCRENPVASVSVISSEASAKCTEAFDNKSSSLRPCYGVVPPKDYQTICEKLSAVQGYSVKNAVCTASEGYAKACQLQYAPVELSERCV